MGELGKHSERAAILELADTGCRDSTTPGLIWGGISYWFCTTPTIPAALNWPQNAESVCEKMGI